MPQLLRDIFRSGLLAEPDVEIVGETEDGAGLLTLCAECRPDVVVLQADDDLEARLESSVDIDRAVKIFAVASDGRDARMRRLQWKVDMVQEVSFTELRDAIVGAARQSGRSAARTATVPRASLE